MTEVATRRLEVRTPEGAYPVVVGDGALESLPALADEHRLGRQVVIATDSTVEPLHGADTADRLRLAGYDAICVAMPAGEPHKSWAAVDTYVRGFAAAGLDRGGWVLALGGGVVGDTAGLAAALYMRGVPLVQAPTTLLAMADASVGGKVAVDHPLGKNLIGAFKQPVAVVADLRTLATLPEVEIANGMAEVIKAAIIGGSGGQGGPEDPVGRALLALLDRRAPLSTELVARAVDVKRRLVEADPYEQGPRALLNLGHTFGHAFERLSGYALMHGFAVARGMMVAARLAEDLGLAPAALTARTADLLAAYGLPLRWGAALPPGTTPGDVVAAMATDKKRRGGRPRYVLAHALGDVRVAADVPEETVLAALAATHDPA